MQSVQARRPGRDVSRYVTVALFVCAAVVLALQLRLVPLLVQGLSGWVGFLSGKPPDSSQAPVSLGWYSALEDVSDRWPWLPWAAWLAATVLLSFQRKGSTEETGPPPVMGETRWWSRRSVWVAAALLVLLLALGAYGRLFALVPQSEGISQLPYDDEGVYAGTSQLFLQGILPYRDYFFAHPPIAAFSYAPAMAYHFTEWGSPTSFMMARYLSVFYSLITLALLFFVGMRLSGLAGGGVAGLLWAVDGRVVEINRKVMLDGPMVLLSCVAVLLYLWARPRLVQDEPGETSAIPRRTLVILALAGVFAALCALTKLAGAACPIALVADMAWIAFDNGRRRKAGQRAPRIRAHVLSLLAGILVTSIVVLGPFLVIAPSQLVRMVFFFQILRPADGLIDIPQRIADVTSTLANALTPLFAALGFAVVTAWTWRRGGAGPWRVVMLWSFFSFLLFTYSRSFYGHYYIQLAAPLCLLGAGISLLPRLLGEVRRGWLVTRKRWTAVAPGALLALAALPLLVVASLGILSKNEDRKFEIVGRYVNNAVPPGTEVLTTDEQFNFLAARPPSHDSTGYLIDSYGHMIFLGLGLNTRSWGDLWADVFTGQRSNDVYAVLRKPVPQADFLDRAAQVPLIVIHDTGRSRLTPVTISKIESETTVADRQRRYTIYRKK